MKVTVGSILRKIRSAKINKKLPANNLYDGQEMVDSSSVTPGQNIKGSKAVCMTAVETQNAKIVIQNGNETKNLCLSNGNYLLPSPLEVKSQNLLDKIWLD